MVRGGGIAAMSCARLLGQAGLGVALEGPLRPKLPAIMLAEATQKLIQDIFERPNLFAGFSPVRRRVVAWGADAKAVTLSHSAVSTSEQALLDRIDEPSQRASEESAAWTIFAASPLPPGIEDQHFGSRVANVAAVKLKPETPSETCWIESLDDGWLFLLPSVEHQWLLSVGGPADAQLARSRVIAGQISEIHPDGGCFPSHPRIAESLCGPGWLACGTAALAFDPLCGDGVGNAAREAILACAVVRAALAGADVKAVTAHYSSRLLAGFRRHLEVCEEFYRSGGSGPWWQEQLAQVRRGIQCCQSRLAEAPEPRYRLNGFSLEALA